MSDDDAHQRGEAAAPHALADAIADLQEVSALLQTSANEITEAAGNIQSDASGTAQENATRILAACSFADVGGQRLQRVEKLLRALDGTLREAGVDIPGRDNPYQAKGEDGAPAAFGPTSDGLGQDDLDALMNGDQ